MSRGEDIAYDVVMVLLSTSAIILFVFLIVLCKEKKKKKKNALKYEETLPAKVSACPYPLTDIDVITNGFDQRRLIGKGRVGSVYAAVLPGGELVAVKRIHPHLVLRNAGLGFSSKIKWLSSAHHPHVASILGFSEAPGERIIVTAFDGLRSLDFYLHHNPKGGASFLDWRSRLRIAAGVARGLEYLHEVMAPPIIHGCVKPSNIILDGKFSARVCDYGLSFLAPKEREGLEGYIDEEYWGGGASKESDVYGLGVVLLELLSGRKCGELGLNIVRWALPLIKQEKYGEVLDGRIVVADLVHNNPLVIRLAKVASACVGNSRKNRPSIVQVSTILNNLVVFDR